MRIDQMMFIIILFATSIFWFFESKKAYRKLIETEWSESDWINARIRPQILVENAFLLSMAYGIIFLIGGIVSILLFTGVMQI
ncbi:MAG: hypothetical protein DRN18_02730 [Thermoplasmata archaeon]|nr:MAG: hypothetical protein DRN18_02730 [Thermoplasmata archaeon]